MTGELNAVRDFARWLNRLPHNHKLVIGGNHDCCFTDHRRSKALDILYDVDGLIYAEDTLEVVQGTGFYCTPWTASFNDWCLQKDEDGLREKFQQIPKTTEVLITHGPAHGTGDWLDGYGHIGSKALKDAVNRVQPDLHIYGHVHQQYGKQADGSYNVSVLDGQYNVVKEPVVIELEEYTQEG